MMGTFGSIRKFIANKFRALEFDESDEVAEEKSPCKSSTRSKKKKSGFRDSPVDKYSFLETFAGEMKPKGKKVGSEPLVVHEIDEAVKERIFRSDAASQSSSSNYNSKILSRPKHPNPPSSYCGRNFSSVRSLTATIDSTNEPVPINSDEDNDDASKMSSNDLEQNKGPSGELQTIVHDITSHDMESSVIISPSHVTYGINRYWKPHLTFSCNSIKLDVSEKGPMGSFAFEWKTADLVSIESRWCEHLQTATVCLHIKSRHQNVAANDENSGILEVKFTLRDPLWARTQELIKLLDARYKDKWNCYLDSMESFEDTIYLEGDCGSISISKRDFQLLQPEKFINDTIVDFYIEYLKKQIKPADQRVHFFNSFFFRKLADFYEDQIGVFDSKEAFQRVRKWTRKFDLFHKDYIFIPINFRLHWSLIVICHPGEAVNFRDEELEFSSKVPCILHMDSIKGSHSGLENCIKCYLWEEWKERNSDAAEDISSKFMNLQFLCLELPQQQNSYDCGLFMLHYMELFVKQASNNFNPLSTFLSKNWFHPTEASLKRAHIKRLICELAKCNSQMVPSSGCVDKCSSEFEDVNEEEADIQFLRETCKSKEACHGSKSDTDTEKSRDATALMVKSLRCAPDLCSSDLPRANAEQMEMSPFDTYADGTSCSMVPLLEFHLDREGFPEPLNNGGSVIAENDQNHGQMVLYNTANVVFSPIKEDEETEDALDKQLVVTGPSRMNAEATQTSGSFIICIDKSLNLLRLKEDDPSEKPSKSSPQRNNTDEYSSSSTNVPEALVVEDSECSSSSSDDVFETCVVEDSDSDDPGEPGVRVRENPPCLRRIFVSSNQNASSSAGKAPAGNCSNVQASKRRRLMVSGTQKRLKRSSSGDSEDLQEIFPCE